MIAKTNAVVSIATICLFFLFHVILSLPKDLGVPHIPPVIASESVAISGDGNENSFGD